MTIRATLPLDMDLRWRRVSASLYRPADPATRRFARPANPESRDHFDLGERPEVRFAAPTSGRHVDVLA